MAVAGLQLSAPSAHGQGQVLLSSVKSSLFSGAPLRFSPPTSGREPFTRKQLVVFARRLSGLEEAMRIKRERESQQLTPKVKRRPPLRRGRVSPELPVPDHIPRPPYVGSSELPEIASELQIPGSQGIADMRAACELAARVLDSAGKLVRSGDIINIDVTVYLNGYHGDTSKTFLCGDVSDAIKQLVKVTEECLERGIAVCKDGASFKKIGKRISEHAEKYGYGVVERFVGHGVGTVFHSEPLILHHRNDQSGCMVEGQTFTIEPILTMGSIECKTWPDNWTTLTADGSPAAQFEHTILITRTGAEILTIC
ncbi:methionine aminopeptidase 1B, chloroplastic isoform X3 [Prunus dulcis]|uniref:methionine aminopeptidase 1B, chloroplastic isoform X3 n=1 Tax=Prunus dulcis TaxID=3755 RepID=UPI00148226FC|nr:methionine aminopeptidase 1B, chloroplastic isoform X3 [Prunus dulcis]